MNQELRSEARLVSGVSFVDILNHKTYSSTLNGVILKLLNVITHRQRLDQLCGNISNSNVNVYTNEKKYSIARENMDI